MQTSPPHAEKHLRRPIYTVDRRLKSISGCPHIEDYELHHQEHQSHGIGCPESMFDELELCGLGAVEFRHHSQNLTSLYL